MWPLAASPEYFLLLSSPWQNWPRFPTARSSHADSYIVVIHYYNDVLLSGLCAPRDSRRRHRVRLGGSTNWREFEVTLFRSCEALRHQLIDVIGKLGLTPASSIRRMRRVAGT
jgi:hypothetical protein